jgi:hypothetical protein
MALRGILTALLLTVAIYLALAAACYLVLTVGAAVLR